MQERHQSIDGHQTTLMLLFCSFLKLFAWFNSIDPHIHAYRRHLYTLFHGNPSGMGGCSPGYCFDGILMPSMRATEHETSAFRIFGSFLPLFQWFKMVDTWFQGHRIHLHTLFHENPSGIDGCSPGWMDVVVWWDHMTHPVDQTKCKTLLMTSGCLLQYLKQLMNE